MKVNVCSYCFGYIAVRRWVKLSVEKSLLVQITWKVIIELGWEVLNSFLFFIFFFLILWSVTFTFTVFEILLLEGTLVLWPTQPVTRSKKFNCLIQFYLSTKACFKFFTFNWKKISIIVIIIIIISFHVGKSVMIYNKKLRWTSDNIHKHTVANQSQLQTIKQN